MRPIEKHKPIRLKKIRDSARDQDCTVEGPMCKNRVDTVVFAHYGEPMERGTALKPDDTSGAYACQECHDWLDGRVSYSKLGSNAAIDTEYAKSYEDVDRRYHWFRAMRRTWRLLVEEGVLK